MKRRMFLKGLSLLPLGLSVFKIIDAKPIEPKVKIAGEKVCVVNNIDRDGGYIVSKEMSDVILRTIFENQAQIKRVLR